MGDFRGTQSAQGGASACPHVPPTPSPEAFTGSLTSLGGKVLSSLECPMLPPNTVAGPAHLWWPRVTGPGGIGTHGPICADLWAW